jgi:hypothetical protein
MKYKFRNYIANLFRLCLVQRHDTQPARNILSCGLHFHVTSTAVGIFFVPINIAVYLFVKVGVQDFSSLWSSI